MSVRFFGAVFIFASCGAFGFLKAASCRREERCLSQLLRLLDLMQNELEYRLSPLPQICANAAREANGCLQKVFWALSQELENQIAPDASSCMAAALASVKDLPPQVFKALIALGNSFGKYDLQGQLNEISAIKQQYLALLEKMRENQDLRLRSYRTLGLCIGAGLAILLF